MLQKKEKISDRLFAFDSLNSTFGFAEINEKGHVISANDSFYRLLKSRRSIRRHSLQELLAQCFRGDIANCQTLIESPAPGVLLLTNGLTPHQLLLFVDELSSSTRIAIIGPSCSSMIQCDKTRDDVYLDPLTQLGNRRLLMETIANWKSKAPESACLAMIMMDLDRFKQVNDSMGHNAGDRLLQLVSKRIRRAARAKDIMIRLGGDEFIVLHTAGHQPDGAIAAAKRLVELMTRPFLVDGQQVHVGASVGIAVLNHGTDSVDDLMKHADLALYSAKDAGRGTFRLFDKSLEEKAIKRRQLECCLRRALYMKEFRLLYQPQIDMPSRKVTGFEALIRWQSPDYGWVAPDEFIPLAEEIGEICPIGKWVIQRACEDAMTWPEEMTVAVNVSPVQFENGNLVAVIRQALAVSGLDPKRLEIEITEGLLIKNIEATLEQLWELQTMGLSIAVDDFGTGYSSLSYLNSFPFSKIKIDQSFVRGEQSERTENLVKAILSLGSSLGMKTIAEGVETETQFRKLLAGGCMAAQGYFISKPIPLEDLAPFIVANSEEKI